MHRLVHVSTLGLATILTLNAGQIQIGGSNGLTSSYVNPVSNVTTNPTPANGSSCAGASNSMSTSLVGWNGCYVPPTTGTSLNKSSYQNNLFSAATPAATVPSSPLSGGGATFARINDVNNPTVNDWITNTTSNSVSSDIVIPIGLYGVDKIWTLLNDYWGANNLVNTSVDFAFSSTSNGSAGLTHEVINLTNGQQIRASVDSANSTAVTCLTTYSTTCASPGSPIATTLASGSTVIGNATVSAGSIFSSEYTAAPGISGARQYAGTTGAINLDYQLFDFGSLHTSEYLVAITIKGILAPSQSGTGANQTRTALSAITVDQIATPEPSTVLLSLTGLGALGYIRRRRRA